MGNENDNTEMKGIMRVRTLLNRKQKTNKKKTRRNKKQKMMVTEREATTSPLSRTQQVAPPTDFLLH